MTERLTYTDHSRPVDTMPLKVDVIMVQVRPDDHDWVHQARTSVQEQSYPHLGFITFDNADRSISIGAAWNACIQASDADLVLMYGDDDAMTADLVQSLVDGWKHMAPALPNLVHLTSHCTVVDQDARAQAHATIQHTGMFLRQFLVDHPFDEGLERHVGAMKVQAIGEAQKAMGQPMSMAILHHYGYIFRQHPWMVSGRPIQFKHGQNR